MKMTTMTMDNSLNMNTIEGLLSPLSAATGTTVGRGTSKMQDLAYVPRSWLKAGVAVPKQKTIAMASKTASSSSGSIWLTLPAENAGEKLLLMLLVGAAVFGICYGFTTALELIQSSPVLHSLATR
jgi:hypothetical protein